VWAEFLVPETATPLAFYDHPVLREVPGHHAQRFGQGTLTYEGTYPSAPLRRAVLLDVLKVAGLTGPDQELPPPGAGAARPERPRQGAPLLSELLG
jgi:beta-galactosidase